MTLSLVRLTLALSAVTAIGCGSEVIDRPVRVPVAGVITLGKQPLANATVVFIPTSHTYPATAMTDENGRYELQTFEPGDGAVPGEFKVTVRKVEVKAGKGTVLDEGSDDGGDTGGEGPPPAVEKSLIPEKYGRAATSGLQASVTETGENSIPFDL